MTRSSSAEPVQPPPTVVPHTHWDREWFLTSEQTEPLLQQLFDGLWQLLETHPGYRFTLDGQMAMVQDYLASLGPQARRTAEQRLRRHAPQLALGPYVAQIDWKVAEESAVRNLTLGLALAARWGEPCRVGWMVDNFGFPGQLPQLHRQLGLNEVVLWRGVDPPEGITLELDWRAADGSQVLVLFIVDSYRNVMRLCDAPRLARQRLERRQELLRPLSRSGVLPLLDGYDLDPEPEDPRDVAPVALVRPGGLLRRVRRGLGAERPPRLEGEQLSGRLVAVFPGSQSARCALKLMHGHAEHLLARVVEPLAALCGEALDLQPLWMLVLANLCHDSIGGVGVDPVHSAMERRYEHLLQQVRSHVDRLLPRLARALPVGPCCLNTNPCAVTVRFVRQRQVWSYDAPAGWLGPVALSRCALTAEQTLPAGSPTGDLGRWAGGWRLALEGGALTLQRQGERFRLQPRVVTDAGDEYSAALGAPRPLQLVQARLARAEQAGAALLRLRYRADELELELELLLSSDPLLPLRARFEGRGVGYALLLNLHGPGRVRAAMPFEWVERPLAQSYAPVSAELEPLLVAAREVGQNREWPMRQAVALVQEESCAALLGRGCYAYTTRRLSQQGAGHDLSLVLVRSVEWLSRPDVPGRVGDAGPLMYTPQAAVRRELELELALYLGPVKQLGRWTASALNPPLLWRRGDGEQPDAGGVRLPSGASLYRGEDGLELTCLKPAGAAPHRLVARLVNSGQRPARLLSDTPLQQLGLDEQPQGSFTGEVAPGRIVTLALAPDWLPLGGEPAEQAVELLHPALGWRVGPERSLPDAAVLRQLEQRATELEHEAQQVASRAQGQGQPPPRQLFEQYRLQREALELRLSALQGRATLGQGDATALRRTAEQLNVLRVKRRSVELLLATMEQ